MKTLAAKSRFPVGERFADGPQKVLRRNAGGSMIGADRQGREAQMSEAIALRVWDVNAAARWTLQSSAIAWFLPTLIGYSLFAYHIAAAFIVPAFSGNVAAWNEDLFVGLVTGDIVGNIALAVHLFIAFVIAIGGPLQLIPQIRTFAPRVHRWNGRIYISIAFVTSLAGIYMQWTRDTFGPDILEHVVSINGVLIMIFAAITLRYAMARKIDLHQRWALRTFMVVSGVWYLRVIYGFLRVVPGETPGSTPDMSGPTNIVIGFASYLLPLAVLELYFFAKRSPSALVKSATGALVLAAAGITSIGVYGAAARWLS